LAPYSGLKSKPNKERAEARGRMRKGDVSEENIAFIFRNEQKQVAD
jgi:hypothetical protein